MINGEYGKGRFGYEFNYDNGLLHGNQRFYMAGEIMEHIRFNQGRIDSVIVSPNIIRSAIDSSGNGIIEVKEISLWTSILGNIYNRDHHFKEAGEYFSDDVFSGKIDICDGRFCPEISLKSFLTGQSVRWRFNQDTLVDRVYYK